MLESMGYTDWIYDSSWSKPSITVQQQIGALCKHLGVVITSTPRAIVVEDARPKKIRKDYVKALKKEKLI